MVRRAWVLLPLFALTACGASYKATLTNVTAMPDGSELGQTSGHMHSGIAAAFSPVVTKSDFWGSGSDTSNIAVATSNPEILQVAIAPSTSSDPYASQDATQDSSGAAGKWVVWAVGPGEAVLTVTADGNVAASIPVTVTDPP